MRQYARIIVEGMDGSGKSTLVKALMKEFPEAILIKSPPPIPIEHIGDWWMRTLGENPPTPIIHDRFFYPELVYGPVLRGKISQPASIINYVKEFLSARAFLIYCRPAVNVIKAGIEAEPQYMGVKENFNQLITAYDEVMHEASEEYDYDRFFLYSWPEDHDLPHLMRNLRTYLNG